MESHAFGMLWVRVWKSLSFEFLEELFVFPPFSGGVPVCTCEEALELGKGTYCPSSFLDRGVFLRDTS